MKTPLSSIVLILISSFIGSFGAVFLKLGAEHMRPGVKGLSENIRVRSIVGRFLEHSRIFQFANGGREEIYMGSADWMPRNLFERCEVVFPVKDKAAKARIQEEILAAYLADTAKARLMQEDGSYTRARNHGGFSSQDFLMRLAEGKTDLSAIPHTAETVAKEGTAKEAPVPRKAAEKAPQTGAAARADTRNGNDKAAKL